MRSKAIKIDLGALQDARKAEGEYWGLVDKYESMVTDIQVAIGKAEAQATEAVKKAGEVFRIVKELEADAKELGVDAKQIAGFGDLAKVIKDGQIVRNGLKNIQSAKSALKNA